MKTNRKLSEGIYENLFFLNSAVRKQRFLHKPDQIQSIVMMLICLLACGSLVLFTSCQNIFTTSPFKDLFKPDVTELPAEQLAGYGQGILINGTDEEKADVLEVLQTAIANGNTDPDTNYIAAILALDQIGLNADIVADIYNPDFMNTLLTEENIALIKDAGEYFATADAGGVDLTTTDNLFGGVGLLLTTVNDISEITADVITNPTPEQSIAVEMILSAASDPDSLAASLLSMLGINL